jgi:hypothetical protein
MTYRRHFLLLPLSGIPPRSEAPPSWEEGDVVSGKNKNDINIKQHRL